MSVEFERRRQAITSIFERAVSDRDQASPAPQPATSPSVGEPPPQAQSSLRILIVEDEMLVAMDTEAVLMAAGHSVVGIAASADDAVAAARDQQPDLVLLDVRLVGARDGIDAAIEIKSRFGTPIVFVTAHNDLATAARAVKASPLAIVAKPVVAENLLDAINLLP